MLIDPSRVTAATAPLPLPAPPCYLRPQHPGSPGESTRALLRRSNRWASRTANNGPRKEGSVSKLWSRARFSNDFIALDNRVFWNNCEVGLVDRRFFVLFCVCVFSLGQKLWLVFCGRTRISNDFIFLDNRVFCNNCEVGLGWVDNCFIVFVFFVFVLFVCVVKKIRFVNESRARFSNDFLSPDNRVFWNDWLDWVDCCIFFFLGLFLCVLKF